MDEDEAWRVADGCSRGGRWAEAGPKWRALAESAAARGAQARAREAASRAADAFRRDDRPVAALAMLKLAWDLGESSATAAAQLSAVLLDLGRVEAALATLREAPAREREPAGRALALDALVGTLLVAGRVDEARAHLDALARLGLPGGELSVTFRQAQVDRLDGHLDRAVQALAGLAATLQSYPPAAAAEAGAWEELGEVAVLRFGLTGDPAALEVAREHFEAAAGAWQRARRRAGRMRTEAWLLRVEALGGETVVTGAIDRAIQYAEERGLVLFEADLRACRGVARRDPADLLRAVGLTAEAPLARGRLRVLLAELGHPVDVGAARAELAADGPWLTRLARATGRDTPPA